MQQHKPLEYSLCRQWSLSVWSEYGNADPERRGVMFPCKPSAVGAWNKWRKVEKKTKLDSCRKKKCAKWRERSTTHFSAQQSLCAKMFAYHSEQVILFRTVCNVHATNGRHPSLISVFTHAHTHGARSQNLCWTNPCKCETALTLCPSKCKLQDRQFVSMIILIHETSCLRF